MGTKNTQIGEPTRKKQVPLNPNLNWGAPTSVREQNSKLTAISYYELIDSLKQTQRGNLD